MEAAAQLPRIDGDDREALKCFQTVRRSILRAIMSLSEVIYSCNSNYIEDAEKVLSLLQHAEAACTEPVDNAIMRLAMEGDADGVELLLRGGTA